MFAERVTLTDAWARGNLPFDLNKNAHGRRAIYNRVGKPIPWTRAIGRRYLRQCRDR